MAETKDELLALVRNKKDMTEGQQMRLALLLAIPSMLAQLSSVLMQYIDTAMVGNLGANEAASIGLVSSSTWIFWGFAMAVMSGFTVQISHQCGAKEFAGARNILRQGFTTVFIFSAILAVIGVSMSGALPGWLGGNSEINDDSSEYFKICMAFMPISIVGYFASASLQASGNVKIPSLTYIGMGVLDVIFNYIFIYVMDMGVPGAALGTGLAETLTTIFVVVYVVYESKDLKISHEKGSFIPDIKILKNAFTITGPMWLQNIIMRGAYVVSTIIVSPLGAVAIAANSIAITAESFCYMPGYGLQEAATTLIGQSLGAGRKDIAKRFMRITVGMAAAVMTFLAVLMFIFAPYLMSLLSSDPEVVALGAKMLRIEAFAETMFAISIAGYGACVGAGDTLIPSVLNFASMWIIRIGLALILTPKLGLAGYWIAMCIELNIRGLLYIIHLRGEKWMKLKFA